MANLNRRQFLKGAALTTAAASLSVPSLGLGAPAPAKQKARRQKDWRQVVLDRDRYLHVYRPASKETVKVCYFRYGKGWQRRGYEQLCHILRDVKSNQARRMDPKLLDLLYIIQSYLRAKKLPYVIHITSGYRTPAHNARLKGAAKDSLHVKGKAADIYVPGIAVKQLSNLVKAIGVGGCGIYPRNNFVHVDVGRFRSWVGKLLDAPVDFELEENAELFAGEQLSFELAA